MTTPYRKKPAPPHAFKPGVSGNPGGRPKGSKNKFTLSMTKVVQNAVAAAGEQLQAEKGQEMPWLLELDAATAYMAFNAIKHPSLFMPMVARLMPAKLDVELGVPGEMVDLLAERRAQLQQLRDLGEAATRYLDVTPIEEGDEDDTTDR